jgi:RNA recognition motif-containing protein
VHAEIEITSPCGVNAADLVIVVGGVSYSGGMPGKAVKMEAKVYVGNLSKSTTQEELSALFAQAGDVLTTEVIKDRKSGESKGFAFITMSAQSEADKAVSMFNAYSLDEKILKVNLANPRPTRGVDSPAQAS